MRDRSSIHPSTETCQKSADSRIAFACGGYLFAKIRGREVQGQSLGTAVRKDVPTPSMYGCWKTNFKTEVFSGSGSPTEAMPWIREIEFGNSVDDLETSQSIVGRSYRNFETVDVRIAIALKKNSRARISGRNSMWKSRRLKRRIGSSVAGR